MGRIFGVILGALLSSVMGSANPIVQNPGFESPVLSSAVAYSNYGPLDGNVWNFITYSGVQTSGGWAPAGFDGNQVGFIQTSGTAPGIGCFAASGCAGEISQTISGFEADELYDVSFISAQRVLNGTSQTLTLYLDDQFLGSFTPAYGGTYYAEVTDSFTTTAGTHTLSFVGEAPPVTDVTAFIDDVSITDVGPVPEPGTLAAVSMGLFVLARRRWFS